MAFSHHSVRLWGSDFLLHTARVCGQPGTVTGVGYRVEKSVQLVACSSSSNSSLWLHLTVQLLSAIFQTDPLSVPLPHACASCAVHKAPSARGGTETNSHSSTCCINTLHGEALVLGRHYRLSEAVSVAECRYWCHMKLEDQMNPLIPSHVMLARWKGG